MRFNPLRRCSLLRRVVRSCLKTIWGLPFQSTQEMFSPETACEEEHRSALPRFQSTQEMFSPETKARPEVQVGLVLFQFTQEMFSPETGPTSGTCPGWREVSIHSGDVLS